MRIVRAATLAAVLAANAAGAAGDKANWNNLAGLRAGQKIEVTRDKGETVKGEFAAFDHQRITLRDRHGEQAVPRAEVKQVSLRKRNRGMWIGAGIGAGGGAAVGAALGARLANESGGDFANLKPAITGVCAGIGALVGALIGLAAASRHTTVYLKP